MKVKEAVDSVRARVRDSASVLELPMSKGRDLAAMLLFDKPYAAAMAAEAAGKIDGAWVRNRVSLPVSEAIVSEYHRHAVDVAAMYEAARLEMMPQERRRFRAVSLLHVYPNTDLVFSQTGKLPFVDATTLDFARITRALKRELRLDDSMSIYACDDYIDLANAHVREEDSGGLLSVFDDYSATVMKPTLRVRGDLVRVRDRWRPLHVQYPRRDVLPPPRAIAVVSEHPNYEHYLRWVPQAGLTLKTHDFASGSLCPRVDSDGRLLPGVMPAEMRTAFEAVFGIPFQDEVYFVQRDRSRFPEWLEQSVSRARTRAESAPQ